MTVRSRNLRRAIVAAAVVVWAAVPPALMVAAWPRWWSQIAPEGTPMTWLQSVALVAAGLLAILVAHVCALTGRPHVRVWWLLAAGFGVLAIDERFAIHERIRDRILAPRDVTIPFLPWVAPGDFLIIGVAVAGLILAPRLWRALDDDRAARTALAAGVLLAVVAVAGDSIDPSTWTVRAERFQQTGEEIVELASGLALLVAVALRLTGLLDELARSATSAPD